MTNDLTANDNQKRFVFKGFLIPFILVTSLFFLWGFAHGCLDVLNKHFQELLHMSKAKSALSSLCFMAAIF